MPCTVKLALWNVAIMRCLCSARSPRENRDIKHSVLPLQKTREMYIHVSTQQARMDVIDSLVTQCYLYGHVTTSSNRCSCLSQSFSTIPYLEH